MNQEDAADWSVLSALPGNPLMWVLIIGELLAFGALLVGFAVARLLHPALFAAGQAALDVWLGGANTLVLVTSGYLAARGCQRPDRARPWLAGAMALGACFLAIKGIEWADIAAHGFGLESDSFHTLFFLLTGFHAAHVVMGIAVLAIVGWKNSPENLETGTAFWHMVDLVWVILFPLLYLVR
ncbi:MAG: cytochrome c oxidase subunit 3 family protein [Actinomycetota bacterium]